MEKYCGKCKLHKSVDVFSKNASKRDGLQTMCKECASIKQRKWYQNNKVEHKKNVGIISKRRRREQHDWMRDYLQTHPCVDCGNSDIRVLQFDHVRGDKAYNITQMFLFSLTKIQSEIYKCDVRCANCHMIRTYKRDGWYRST